MQKTIKYVMVAFVAIISIASCKKEINWNAKPDPNGNGCKLTTVNADLGILGQYSINYVYDASGKLTKATSDGESRIYTYTETKITGVLPDGEKTELTISGGKAVSSYNSDFFNVNGVSIPVTRTYAYNADGYLSVVKSYLDKSLNSTAELTYSNGNLIQSKITYTEDGEVETTTYEYSSQLAVNPYETSDPISVIVDYMPGGYFGKHSKNVVIKSIQRSAKLNAQLVSDYSYKFDAKGNAIYTSVKSAQKLSDGTVLNESSAIFNLVYNCK
ncbi:hypothetical protein QF042_000919 [Pedobacter sp. W3I1]|uniref:hypothetical protein n=1 Tax=Pedobacter sp. W3I1 TaxID=3042291 RepID=UPI00277FE0E2|nr:hypothetical protein [Pedobacter sp. W3I1]MDQ0637354.1 hypothetical protein [Pedobacter sp. W3I1]